MTRLAEMLRTYRALENIGLRDMAKEIGLGHATLSRIERGYQMDAVNLMKVLNWLLTREDRR